ncbi:MAG TPA: anaerobic sulfatase maturase [Phycisphaerae bacterium]|nr:anaerobic sulfatase maturase [Phycisphaerae bacterium]HDZ43540.1 anaerobic sulfatase maturase [Phycisphaerae bacterium]
MPPTTTNLPPFSIMCKPVCGTCNLDCAYCYYTSKAKELYPDVARPEMSDEVLEAYTRQYLQAMPVQSQFMWQGGEPLLAGMDFFERALALQSEHKLDGQTVTNGLQTNGTLIDERWCELFKANGFLVGVSIDGTPQWHDYFRRDHAGNPSFHRAWAGLDFLKTFGVEFNVLVTLNSANIVHGGDIYRWFTNRGAQYLQFIPILERDPQGVPQPFSCSGEQYGRFLLDVYEVWRARDVGRVSVRLFDSVMHNELFGAPSTCCYSQRCANAYVLEFNGDLFVCDHFVFKEWRVGNIMDRPLAELVLDPLIERFATLKTDLPEACRDCEYLPFCHGGCPKHHWPIGPDAGRVNHYCEGLKLFFREALSDLKQLAHDLQAGGGQGEHASASRSVAPNANQGPAARPKRNEPCPCGSGRKFKLCCGRK